MKAEMIWAFTKKRNEQQQLLCLHLPTLAENEGLFVSAFGLLFKSSISRRKGGKKKAQRVRLTARIHDGTMGYPANINEEFRVYRSKSGALYEKVFLQYSEVATSRTVRNDNNVHISFTRYFCGIAKERRRWSSTRVPPSSSHSLANAKY